MLESPTTFDWTDEDGRVWKKTQYPDFQVAPQRRKANSSSVVERLVKGNIKGSTRDFL
jgi:RecA-family ATPase